MKKWLVYILLSSFILTNTDLIQVLRVPNLMSHFNEHNKLETLSFRTYLADHYWDKNHVDDDADRDNSLPFKSIITSVYYIFNLVTLPNIAKVEVKIPTTYVPHKIRCFKKFHYLSTYLASCWNPPKM
ncbi:hypothetical protein K5I29_02880 [Flavobacterium agricola]|uniref:Uncharacterized protein n=1 Tax=Flavobacterium agricola TaxID=2870839 RepID=A0ABY6M008_9FLAO|nr:hypothetical protein [Flavobacterium agricola]UYW01879.1 hypothetical protein K5I29_02880 [Flavobacterium agricola]